MEQEVHTLHSKQVFVSSTHPITAKIILYCLKCQCDRVSISLEQSHVIFTLLLRCYLTELLLEWIIPFEPQDGF